MNKVLYYRRNAIHLIFYVLVDMISLSYIHTLTCNQIIFKHSFETPVIEQENEDDMV